MAKLALYTVTSLSVQFLSFSCSVRGKIGQTIGWRSSSWGWRPRLGYPGSATAIASSSEAIGILTVNIENQRMLNGLISVDLACFLYWSSPYHRILYNLTWNNEAPHTAVRTDQGKSGPWGRPLCTLSRLMHINGVFQKKSTRFAKFDISNLLYKESILNQQFLISIALGIDCHIDY